MTTLKMHLYGTVLTGRDHGQKVMRELAPSLETPVVLDFKDVGSLGSSFGDEVVAEIAKLQGGRIGVLNAPPAVWDCLNNLMEDHGIEIFEASMSK